MLRLLPSGRILNLDHVLYILPPVGKREPARAFFRSEQLPRLNLTQEDYDYLTSGGTDGDV